MSDMRDIAYAAAFAADAAKWAARASQWPDGRPAGWSSDAWRMQVVRHCPHAAEYARDLMELRVQLAGLGAQLPLECIQCGGRGVVLTEQQRTCERCGGSGVDDE